MDKAFILKEYQSLRVVFFHCFLNLVKIVVMI